MEVIVYIYPGITASPVSGKPNTAFSPEISSKNWRL